MAASSSAHSYILLIDKGEDYPRGTIVEPSSRANKYIRHSHRLFAPVDEKISADTDQVGSLTRDECRILDGLRPDEAYTVYCTPNKMAWGVGLKNGDTVLARLPQHFPTSSTSKHQDIYAISVIRWCGIIDHEGYFIGVEITERKHYGSGDSDGLHWTNTRYFSCPKNCGLYITMAGIKEPPCNMKIADLQDCVSELEKRLTDKTREIEILINSEDKLRAEIAKLQGEVKDKVKIQEQLRKKEATIAKMETEMREKKKNIARLEQDGVEKDAVNAKIRNVVDELQTEVARLQARLEVERGERNSLEEALTSQREQHAAKIRKVKKEAEQYQRQWMDEQAQHQHLASRIETAMAYLRGETTTTPQQALQPWELSREQVHTSKNILETAGWGFVCRGTFQGQLVAIKCLCSDIFTPQNEVRLRREISTMSQVHHPNILQLIGAVLTNEGVGPLIITELLDTSLHSTYQNGTLEERSKLSVLRDVASALTHLHSHHTPIIHSDVNSSSVFLEAIHNDDLWQAKLSDTVSASLNHLTMHLTTTPAEGASVYAAPEVSTEVWKKLTPKIDVYSFGVLVCEVCLCRILQDRRDLSSILREVRNVTSNMFALARDCTRHAHQDRPDINEVLQSIEHLRDL